MLARDARATRPEPRYQPPAQVAEARVAETLAALPSDRWLVERYALIAGHRIPFLVLGETGVFVICALTGPPAWDELRLPAQVAEQHVMPTAARIHRRSCASDSAARSPHRGSSRAGGVAPASPAPG